MEILLFTLVAILLYLISDGILKAIEKHKGRLLESRSIIFFIIISILSLTTFNLLQIYGPKLGLLPKPVQVSSPDSEEKTDEVTDQ